jgi:hypothetical protein
MDSFAERLDKALSVMGVEMLPLAFDVARIPWDYPSQFNEFLTDFTGEQVVD